MPDAPPPVDGMWTSLPALITNVGVPAAMAIIILLLLSPKIDSLTVSVTAFHERQTAFDEQQVAVMKEVASNMAKLDAVLDDLSRGQAVSAATLAQERQDVLVEVKRQEDLLSQCVAAHK